LPALAITQNGTIGLLYDSYDPVTNQMSQHLLTTGNDFASTTDTTLASETNATPVATFDPYVGDFYDMMSVGNTFYGVFSASNADNGSNAQFTNVVFQRDFIGTPGTASFQLTNASGQAVTASIDPFLFTYQAPSSPPTLSNVAANAAWTEESTAATLAPGLTVSDAGTTLMSSATVAITGGTFAGDADVLAATVSGTSITASYSSATETLTLTGTDTLAHYQSALESVAFHAGENPTGFGSNATRTVIWTITDSAGLASTPVTSFISITNVNDPPTLSNVASSIVAAPTATISLSPSVTVTDPDSLKLTGATVSITGGTFSGDGDVLAANVSGTGIAASYNSSTETLTLAGSDTLAHYRTLLDSVTWHSTAGDPTNGGSNATRTITWVVNDGSTSFNLSTTQTETLTLDQPPTLSGLVATASWTEEQAQPTILSPNITISDPDGVNTQLSATVAVVGGAFSNDGDVLAADTTGTNITASYNSTTEILTLTGSDSLAHYQVLDSVTFHAGENPTDFGSNPTRTLAWTVASHLGGESAPATTTVSLTNVNDPPTLSNVATSATFVTGTLSPSLSLSDPDNLNLASATVRITGGSFAGDGDVLAATTGGTGIAASYNSSTQTLTLTGSDTLAHYQSVLDSVTFTAGSNPTNSGANPTRTISWVINDGAAASTAALTTVTIGSPPRNDFNADSKSDLLLQNAPNVGTPDVRVELLNGTTVTSSATVTTPTGWTVEATGDFNHDSKADIIVQTADGTPQIWLMNGTSVTSTVTLSNSGPTWHVIATGDFNSDGNTDILWQNNDGLPVIWFMNATSLTGGAVLPNSGPSWHVIGTGDFNGDGKSDIIWQNTDGLPFIWEMNGASIIGAGALPNSGPSWHVIGTGDFNGDGKADLLWQNDDGLPVIWEMNGTSMIGGAVLPNSGPSWHAIGTSDFNGDGKSDIIWQSTDGLPFIWEMNGASMIGAFALPNPGPTWHVKDDGPISPDPAGAGAQPPTLHLSAPDAASAVPMRSAPDGTTGVASSDPSFMHQLHTGTT
jgi:lipopolysaccharide export system protein LptA